MKYGIGDRVIYRKTKVSNHPGVHAIKVYPSSSGEDYHYNVDKYWVIVDIVGDLGTIVAKTRRGKVVQIDIKDNSLRKANIIERFMYRDRFPKFT